MSATIGKFDVDKVNSADIVIRASLINVSILFEDRKFVDEATAVGEVGACKALLCILERLQQSGIEGKCQSKCFNTKELGSF